MTRAAALFLAVASCGGMSAQMRASSTASCPDVLANEAALRGDPRYAREPPQERAAYELAVAECDMQAGRAQAALDLADSWHDAVAVRRDKLRVRALAVLNRPDALREALGTLAGETDLGAEYFIDTTELGPFEASDWLVPVAVQSWQRHPGSLSLRHFASALLHVTDAHLVDLARVSADAGHPPGEWAVWTGTARDARVDREGNRTLVEAEGVDLRDERAESATETLASAAAQGEPFVVRFARANDALVHVGTFTAFGHYAGRDAASGSPVLDALIVVERAPSAPK